MRDDELAHERLVRLESSVAQDHVARSHGRGPALLIHVESDATVSFHAQPFRGGAEHERAAAALQDAGQDAQQLAAAVALPALPGLRGRRRQRVLTPRFCAARREARALVLVPAHGRARELHGNRCLIVPGEAPGVALDRLQERSRVVIDVAEADVEHAAGNPYVAGIALVAALFQHDHFRAALGEPRARREAGQPGAYDRDIMGFGGRHACAPRLWTLECSALRYYPNERALTLRRGTWRPEYEQHCAGPAGRRRSEREHRGRAVVQRRLSGRCNRARLAHAARREPHRGSGPAHGPRGRAARGGAARELQAREHRLLLHGLQHRAGGSSTTTC